MKKIVLLIVLSLLAATHGYAACTEGTEIPGKNGHVYCKSKISMNWYTAFAWCDTQKRTLATMGQMCDIDETQRWDGNFGEGKCLNLVGASSENVTVWSARSSGSDAAFNVYLSTAKVTGGNRTYNYYALCW